MALLIDLSPEKQAVLEQEAARQGIPPPDYARHLLEKSLPVALTKKQQEAIELLRTLREEGDVQEQREIFQAIKQGLNQNHTSDRVLFP